MELPDDAIHIWFVDQADVDALELELLAVDWLQSRDQERYGRFYFDHHRKQFLLGKWLTRVCLSEYAPQKPGAWNIIHTEFGKPELADGQLTESLCFNLSHSGDRLVLAVCRHPNVGIDIENTGRRRRVEKIADRYFAPAEIDALLTLPEARQLERFYDLWTLKEAYIKARGLGLAIALDSFGFDIEEGKLQLTEYVQPGPAPNWQIWQLACRKPFKLALALQSEAIGKITELRSFQRTSLGEFAEQELSILRTNE